MTILLLIMLLLQGPFRAEGSAVDSLRRGPDSTAMVQNSAGELRKIPNNAFGPGEYLKFNINYGVITAGEAVLKISDTIVHHRPCLKVEFTLRSKPFFDIFYRVDDHYLTVIDSAGVFPWRFEQHVREGSYSRDFTADFDQVGHTASTSEGTHPIPPYVNDIMSAFYYARTLDYSAMPNGEKIHLQNFFKDSTFDLEVKYRGKQTVEVEAGNFRCHVVEPIVKAGGLFKSDGKIFVWMTDDRLKIPVRVNTKIPIGSVDAELTEYYGLRGHCEANVPKE
jgi:hypothetical protein